MPWSTFDAHVSQDAFSRTERKDSNLRETSQTFTRLTVSLDLLTGSLYFNSPTLTYLEMFKSKYPPHWLLVAVRGLDMRFEKCNTFMKYKSIKWQVWLWDYFKKEESCLFLFLNTELQGNATAQEATDCPQPGHLFTHQRRFEILIKGWGTVQCLLSMSKALGLILRTTKIKQSLNSRRGRVVRNIPECYYKLLNHFYANFKTCPTQW